MTKDAEPLFVNLLSTCSATDIALIKSALDARGLHYYFQGENTFFLRGIEPARLMVASEDIVEAREALRPLKLIYSPRVFGHP